MTDVLAGNPTALGTKADAYIRSAQAILEAAQELENLVFDQRSRSTDAVGTAAREVAQGLHAAHGRYSGTASALKTYSVELARIQQNYRTAQEEAATADAAGGRADYEIGRLKRTITVNEDNDASPQAIERLELELQGWQRRANSADGAVDNAQELIGTATSQFEEAAQRAISAIDTAIAEGKDSFWDHLRQFVEDLYATFVNIAKWAAEALKPILAALVEIVTAILTIMIIALLIIAVIAALPLVLAAAIIGLHNPGLSLALLAAALGPILLLVGGLVLVRVLSDVLKPAPTITKVNPRGTGGDPARLGDVFGEASEVDDAGGTGPGPDESTVVKIEKIVDEYGNVSWRVVLPSTQDWQALAPFMSDEQKSIMEKLAATGQYVFDDGSTADVDSNIALMLFPELRTQYERAVIAAMEEAGVRGGPDGDPIMLVGFSQGGIMAGHLAANRSEQFNFQAVIVGGSPIDTMNIPPKTTVVSFQHTGDVVHQLDLAPGQQKPNWLTIGDDPPLDADGNPQVAHNADSYQQTMSEEEHMEQILEFAPEFEQFFPTDVDGNPIPGSEAETSYYAWAE